MTVSMRLMTAGHGYEYLLKSVAAGDGRRELATPLTRYYLEAGCPPGWWFGAGLAALATADGRINVGDVVTEQQLQWLIGQGRHPLTGEQLGRALDNVAAWKARTHGHKPKTARTRHRAATTAVESTTTIADSVVAGQHVAIGGAQTTAATTTGQPGPHGRHVAAHHPEPSDRNAVERTGPVGRQVARHAVGDPVRTEPLAGDGSPVHGAPSGRGPVVAHPAPRHAARTKTLTQSGADAKGASNGAGAPARDGSRAAADGAPVAHRRPVAGYDYTFSVPKSVSVLWGLADAGLQEQIVAVHHAAVGEVVALMEREVVSTRAGSSTFRGGPVLHVPVDGVAASGFDHWDSRAGDPQLHTHVVISNKVHTSTDGRWRAIDSRPMHHATVAISELYNAVLADGMTRTFGLGWQQRLPEGRDRNPSWEIAGVPPELITEFSARSVALNREADRLIDDYRERYGYGPSDEMKIRLRQQATLATRPPKELHSLAEMTATWHQRAAVRLGRPAGPELQQLVGPGRGVQAIVRADDIPDQVLGQVAGNVLAVVGQKRSTWNRWNLHAEATRQMMGWRFATLADRERVTNQVVETAEAACVRLTPDALTVPGEFARADGSSRFRPLHHALYTSQQMLDAENRLLELSRDTTGPIIAAATMDAITNGGGGDGGGAGLVLSDDQADALHQVATSGRVVDVLVGPAGAGKTTALAALRSAWEAEHGAGSVVGLAPSATAAAVLAEDLGIATENTAKWLTAHERSGNSFTAGQLVIIDEASLAGTFALDQIANLAAQAKAKVLLVGDWAQLQSVAAGGAFRLLVDDRPAPPALADVHRFTNDWEKLASLQLRAGRHEAIDTYQQHDRVVGGAADTVLDAAYTAWHTDDESGKSSLLIADTTETVHALNKRARSDLIAAGTSTLPPRCRCAVGSPRRSEMW